MSDNMEIVEFITQRSREVSDAWVAAYEHAHSPEGRDEQDERNRKARAELGRKWVVDVKGSADRAGEIAVMRNDNLHGRASYGWGDDDKIILSDSGSKYSERVWGRMLKSAQTMADEMNAEEAILGERSGT